MITEYAGSLLTTTSLAKWTDIAESIIKYTPEIIGTATGISLAFKKTREKYLYPVLRYIYVRIPFMKRIAWLEAQQTKIMSTLTDMKETNSAILKEVQPNGNSSLRDAVDRVGATVAKLRAGQKMIFDSEEYGIMELDENGLLLTANEKILEWTDRKIEELTRKDFYNIFHSDDREWIAKQIMSAVFEGSIFDLEVRIMTNSAYFKYRMVGRPTTSNNRITGYLVTLKKL